ncbi:MAG: c-type cytochrome [Planctomycetes bacterium]|nr:c-type cytochrome [Planctomycetota bacterium]
MKIGSILSCSVLFLGSLAFTDGDRSAGPSAAPATVPGQDPKPLPRVRIDYETVKRLFGKDPTADEVDNPSTPEKVALGKLLYHDASLSKNGNISCASCHDLANYGQDGKPTSPGTDGKNGERNTPTTWNAFRQFRQFWDGRAATVEEQSTGPVLNPVEHGLADEAAIVAKLKAKPELVEAFGKAFPGGGDAVSVANFKLAVGAFERTLVTKSRWDQYLDGNQKALTQDELFGLKAFIDVGCMTCHVTRLVGGQMYQKTGTLKPYPSKDEGRMQVTKSEADKFMFKVPSLLNVEKTAPYMHDGKVATLEEAVTVMADIQLGQKLTPDQLRGIVAFLKSLTGALPADYAPKK